MNETIKPKKQKVREQFDEKWRDAPFLRRCIKYFLSLTDTQEIKLLDYQTAHIEGVNYNVADILDGLVKGNITEKELAKSGTVLADKFKNANKEFLEKLGLLSARQQRSATLHAQRLLKGYKSRNGSFPATPPRLRKKNTISLTDGVIKEKENILVITTLNGEKLKVLFEIPKGFLKNKLYKSKSFGGNLKNKISKRGRHWEFVVLATPPIVWQYEPIGKIGFDLNKTDKYFIVFSDNINMHGDVIPHTKDMKSVIESLIHLNASLDGVDKLTGKKVKSSQRSAIRRKIGQAHKKLGRLCMPYCRLIIDWAIKNKLLICIDDLSCGADSGSFGHDKIVKTLVKLCENESIPFVCVPTPHTSKSCNQCGKECERKHDKLTCPDCGEINSHKNGAINIANWGWKIWEAGMIEFKKWKKNWYKPLGKSAEYKENIG